MKLPWLTGPCEIWRWIEIVLCAVAWWTGERFIAVFFLGAAIIEILGDYVDKRS